MQANLHSKVLNKYPFPQALTCIPAARDKILSCSNQGKEQYDPQVKDTPQSKE